MNYNRIYSLKDKSLVLLKDRRLFSRSMPKDIDHRLKEHNGDIEQVYTEVILEMDAANDKWKRKFLKREADELFRMYCEEKENDDVCTETDNT